MQRTRWPLRDSTSARVKDGPDAITNQLCGVSTDLLVLVFREHEKRGAVAGPSLRRCYDAACFRNFTASLFRGIPPARCAIRKFVKPGTVTSSRIMLMEPIRAKVYARRK